MNSKDYILKLKDVIDNDIKGLLNSESCWDSLIIEAFPPVIHRLSYKIDENLTIFLHKLFNTNGQKALMHSHSWDFAIKVLKGGYEMGVGFSNDRNIIPEANYVSYVKDGDIYSMTDEKIFHYTKPILNDVSYSIMVVGPRKRERKALNNNKLTKDQVKKLIEEFKAII